MFRALRKIAPLSLCAAAATGAYMYRVGDKRAQPYALGRCAEERLATEFPRQQPTTPARSDNTTHAPYVIIGAGTTAHAAIESIIQSDPTAEVLLIVDREDLPKPPDDVNIRPPSVKPNAAIMRVYNEWRRHICGRLELDTPYDQSDPLKIVVSSDVQSIDVDKRRIVFKDQTYITYEKCLLAQAGKPEAFYVLDSSKISFKFRDKINTCMHEEDFYQLDNVASMDDIRTITVLGGGFLGTEVAFLLATNCNGQKEIQHVYAEEAPLVRYLPSYLSEHLKLILTLRGVRPISLRVVTRISTNKTFKSIEDKNSDKARMLTLQTVGANTANVKSDYIVLASTKIDPQNSLATASGLEVDPQNGGVCTNGHFEAANGLFVAGVGASYFDGSLGRRREVSYDHCINSGMLAGRNMVASRWAGLGADGADEMHSYHHQPVFRSSLPGAGVQMVGIGEVDTRMATIGVWLRPPVTATAETAPAGSVERLSEDYNIQSTYDYQRGIVYYISDGKIRGIVLWNAEDLLEQARDALITQASSGTSLSISAAPLSQAEEGAAIEEHTPDPTTMYLQNLIKIGPSEWSHVLVEQPRKKFPYKAQNCKTSL